VALYILNQKRAHLSGLEQRFGLNINIIADESVSTPAHFVLEQGEPVGVRPLLQPVSIRPTSVAPEHEFEATGDVLDASEDEDVHDRDQAPESQERKKKRRRRRKRGDAPGVMAEAAPTADDGDGEPESDESPAEVAAPEQHSSEGGSRRRRRGRRGGRRAKRGPDRLPATNGAETTPQPSDALEMSRAYQIAEELTEAEPEPAYQAPSRSSDDAPEATDYVAPETTHDQNEPSPPNETSKTAETGPGDEQPPPPKGERRGGWWQRRGFF
jgi:ribonuclease E